MHFTGKSPDAFNDYLRGGFGTFELNDKISIVWKHSKKSENEIGKILFAKLIGVIRLHENIELVLK
ncbi:MAG: Barstar (barnase inhibitor) [Candidatus Micrarchaeota archaeon]